MYSWGSYSGSLLNYYKNPQEVEEFSTKLRETIDKAEAAGGKVPPGVYAEYGYTLLEQGDEDGAAFWFSKESEAWPESAYLMQSVTSRMEPKGQADEAATNGAGSGS